jgi:hypothetical protein
LPSVQVTFHGRQAILWRQATRSGERGAGAAHDPLRVLIA